MKKLLGEIVLFKTMDGDRPMLILKVWDESCVNGKVFLDGWNDQHLNMAGTKVGDEVWVTSVPRGFGVGEWREKDEEETDEQKTA